MAVERSAVMQPSDKGGNGNLPKASGFTKSPARGDSPQGSGNHSQKNIRSR